MWLYVLLMIFLGTILDTASIILIVVPLFLPLTEALDLSLIWFGIITVVGAKIGLLTPPLGISCFVTKGNITDVFMGDVSMDTDARTRKIMGSLVKHLHVFARETNLTHDEWRQGIDVLQGCAAIESEDRHEFVLASSVLGPFHVCAAPLDIW